MYLKFLKKKNRGSLFQYILFSVQKCFGWTVLYITAQMIVSLLPTVMLSVNAQFIDSVADSFLSQQISKEMIGSAVLLMSFILVNFLVPVIAAYVSVRLNVNLSMAYDLELTRKKSRIRYSLLENSETHELMERVCEESSDKMYTGIVNIFTGIGYVMRLIGIMVTLMVSDLTVGLLAGMLLVMIIPICMKGGKEDYEAYEESSKQYRKAKYLKGVLSDRRSASERTLFGFSQWMNQKWDNWFERGRELSMRATKRNFIRIKLCSMVTVLASGAIMLLMLPGISNGSISVGLYVATITAVIEFIQIMTWNVSVVVENLVISREYMKDVSRFEELEEDEQIQTATEIGNVETIKFCDVSFTYPQSTKKILDHVSFTLKKGKTYALVGENGCGKSTLVKLMLGLFKDYEGQIFINEQELREIPDSEFPSLFSCAFQDFARYELSIKENITIGCENQPIQEESVQSLIETVGLSDFVSGLPNGLETKLGKLEEDGVDLSGGQWQGISIARTLIKDVPVCILDEPTASLDPMNEKKIYGAIRNEMQNKIGFLVTHRLGGAAQTDEILVLKDGKMCEIGTFSELLKKNEVFSHLYDMQRSWYQ